MYVNRFTSSFQFLIINAVRITVFLIQSKIIYMIVYSNKKCYSRYRREINMTTYISNKTFFTRGVEKDQEIASGVIPGLRFKVIDCEKDIVYLENIDSNAIIIVTEDMLNSNLFIIGK